MNLKRQHLFRRCAVTFAESEIIENDARGCEIGRISAEDVTRGLVEDNGPVDDGRDVVIGGGIVREANVVPKNNDNVSLQKCQNQLKIIISIIL